MITLKNLWRRGMGVSAPERDQHLVACDTLMSELDFHIREFERYRQEVEQEERRLKTGVDYSWLMENNHKGFEMPQMERLELEDLCYKVSGEECTEIISLFRVALSRDPRVEELPFILRSCVKKTLDGRPTPETLAEWVTKRTPSLASLSSFRPKPSRRVAPHNMEAEDIEMQMSSMEASHRAFSVPDFSIREDDSGSVYSV